MLLTVMVGWVNVANTWQKRQKNIKEMNYIKWTKKTCIADAAKYKTRGKWLTASQSAYQAARKNGWLDHCCKHMVKETLSRFTQGDCIIQARRYTSLNEWRKAHRSTWNAAVRMGWLKDITELVWGGTTRVTWTMEMCKAEAAKYKTRSEWRKQARNSYRAALKNNCLDECCRHMLSRQ